ncbi:MAG: GlsB/YeaQ/YmgE family stress response membrane protein [Mycobacteriales bacterium]|nr:GlsB/YeaQ/YmgE family stress response membrane protein [Frankia sp.]
MFIVWLILAGLVVGALARLLMPGPDPMSIPMTIVIGIVGSLIAGFLARAIFGSDGAGLIFAVVVTMGLVWVVRRTRGRAAV